MVDGVSSEPVSEVPHDVNLTPRFDAAFEQQFLDLAWRQWKSDVHHNRQGDDVG